MGLLHYFGITGPPHERPKEPLIGSVDFWRIVFAVVLGNLIATAIAVGIAVAAFDVTL